MISIWLGVFTAMIVLAVPAGMSLRRASRPFDPPRTSRRAAWRDVGEFVDGLGPIGKPAVYDQAARWQHCGWCDPAGDAACTPADCACLTPCAQPSGLWCAAARPAPRAATRITASIAAIGHHSALTAICPPCNGEDGPCTCAGLCGHPGCIGDHTVLHDMAAELDAMLREGDR